MIDIAFPEVPAAADTAPVAPAPAAAAPAGGLAVNPALLVDDDPADPASRPTLPAGVYYEDQGIPDSRTELFRANGRVYTVPKKIGPKIMFKYMRALHQGRDEIAASGEMLYALVGEQVIDFLADEDLTDGQMEAVMTAVRNYTLIAAKAAGLGK